MAVELCWPNKYDEHGLRRGPATSISRRRPDARVGLGSLYVADFREVLPALDAGTIDFIYADPPFNADRDRHFLSTGPRRGRAYADRWSSEAYLNFLDDLILLGRRALKPTGVMAVHVDHRATHWVRALMDEHFGADLFINELIWRYGLGNARAARRFAHKHDVISVYAKSLAYPFEPQRGAITTAQAEKYCHKDSHGQYMMSYGRKYYLKGGKRLDSVLDIPTMSPTDRSRTGYPTQKPFGLLETLLRGFCPRASSGTVVLDPVCGSGTTLEAAQRLGLSWIGIDQNPEAISISKERVKAAELDGGSGGKTDVTSRRHASR